MMSFIPEKYKNNKLKVVYKGFNFDEYYNKFENFGPYFFIA